MLRKRKLGGGAEVPALQAPLSTLPRHRPKRAAELVVANWTLLFFVLLTAAGLLPAAGARQGGRPAAAAATEAAAAAAALPRRRLAALAPKTPNISAVPADLPLHWISLPQGFRIEVYANASFPVRFLSVGNRGSRTPAMITYASTLIGYVRAGAGRQRSRQQQRRPQRGLPWSPERWRRWRLNAHTPTHTHAAGRR